MSLPSCTLYPHHILFFWEQICNNYLISIELPLTAKSKLVTVFNSSHPAPVFFSEILCDSSSANLPPHTHIAQASTVTGEQADLTCDTSYAIRGNRSLTTQKVTCIGFFNWDLSGTLPCEGILNNMYW